MLYIANGNLRQRGCHWVSLLSTDIRFMVAMSGSDRRAGAEASAARLSHHRIREWRFRPPAACRAAVRDFNLYRLSSLARQPS